MSKHVECPGPPYCHSTSHALISHRCVQEPKKPALYRYTNWPSAILSWGNNSSYQCINVFLYVCWNILYNTRGCPPPPCMHVCVCVCHKFCIQLALPISPEIMDRFWCSRCLNDYIKVPNMMRLYADGTTTPLVVKIWAKQPWVKIEYSCNFDGNFVLFRGKIWL